MTVGAVQPAPRAWGPGARAGRFAVRTVNRLAGIGALLALWEVLPRSGLLSSTAVPPLDEVLRALGSSLQTAAFWTALRETVAGWAIGLAVAAVAGVVVGLAIGGIRITREMTESLVEFLRPIPSVALVPLVVLIWGTDIRSTLLLVVYAAFWQVLIQVLYGMQDVDPVLADTARSYRFGLVRRTTHVVWPSALPFILTGLRLAATVALVIEITGELVIGGRGLGSVLALTQAGGDTPGTYAIVLVSGLLGLVVNLLAVALERVLLRWHVSQRAVVS